MRGPVKRSSKKLRTALVGHIQKFSVEDGPGIRSTVFLKGCPLHCAWCHNPELISPFQELIQSPTRCIGCGACIEACPSNALSVALQGGILIDRSVCTLCLACTKACYAQALRPVARRMSVEEVLKEAAQDKDFYDSTQGGLTLSGGEVLFHADFVQSLITEAEKQGISVCLDTSGYGSAEMLVSMTQRPGVDTVLFDIKTIDNKTHRNYTGVDNKLILENLRLLAANERCRKKIIVRMPLIKDVNDSTEAIQAAAVFLSSVRISRVDLLPYHNLGIQKKRNIGGVQEEFQAPSDERVEGIRSYLHKRLQGEVGILGKL